MARKRSLVGIWALLAALSACSSPSGGRVAGGVTAPKACDPLLPHELPVTVGTVLGVGQDGAAGLIYMADEVPATATARVFVSAGDTLFRKRVIGSGSSGGGADADYSLTFNVGDFGDQDLLIQRRAGKVTAMALGSGGVRGFIGTPGVVVREITVRDTSAIAGMKVRNLPGDVTIEYVADVENGNVIVVTHPTDDFDYTDFRLFYGLEGEMLERTVDSVTRTRGSDTFIRFRVGSALFEARFSFVIAPTDGGAILTHRGPASLVTGDGGVLSATERDPVPTTLPGFSFQCIR